MDRKNTRGVRFDVDDSEEDEREEKIGKARSNLALMREKGSKYSRMDHDEDGALSRSNNTFKRSSVAGIGQLGFKRDANQFMLNGEGSAAGDGGSKKDRDRRGSVDVEGRTR